MATPRNTYDIWIKVNYFLILCCPILALVVCFFIRSGTQTDAILASHVAWQMRTLWVLFAVVVVCYILTLTIIASLVSIPCVLFVFIWSIYRVIKGLCAIFKGAAIA